jgi:hypothetical protein
MLLIGQLGARVLTISPKNHTSTFFNCRLMPARQILFALPKKYSKTLVQKNAIAEHRSFSLQNAFSIDLF